MTTLPITKEQFINSIPNFINKYKRLPYMDEDDIEIELYNDDGELEIRPYSAGRYIKEYYKTQNKLTESLFKDELITYKLIGDIYNLTETVVKNAITKETKYPQPEVRRAIDIFFNKDYYEELGKYNGVNEECKKKCKYPYWVNVLSCGVHSKKKK